MDSLSRGVLRIVLLSAIVLTMTTLALGADVNGTWTATFPTQIGEQSYTYTFQVDGEKLTGTAKSEMAETPIEDGTVKGKEISFTENLEFQGQKIPITYKGIVNGDEIDFTREVGSFATEKFAAHRKK